MIESMVTYAVVCALGMVLVSLAIAFRRIAMGGRGSGDSRAAVQALTVRVALSIGLVVFLVIASSLGLLKPHGLMQAPPGPSGAPAVEDTQSQ